MVIHILSVNTAQEIIDKAIRLYENEADWYQAQTRGFAIISELFDRDKNAAHLLSTFHRIVTELTRIRQENIVGAMLWYHGTKGQIKYLSDIGYRSTEYFSKYLERKRTHETR